MKEYEKEIVKLREERDITLDVGLNSQFYVNSASAG